MTGMHEPNRYQKFTYLTVFGSELLFKEFQNKITWNKNEMILDMGCGTGEVTCNVLCKVAPPDAEIIGVDISSEMIEFAKSYFSKPHITYMTADITDDLHLTMKNELFTKIVSFFALYRIKNNRKVFQNMYHLLKPGGEIIMLIPYNFVAELISPLLARLPKYCNYSEQLSKMKLNVAPTDDLKSYTENLLNACGFEVITCYMKTYKPQFVSVNSFVDCYSLTSQLKYILPKELFEEALKDAVDVAEANNLLEKDEDKYKTVFHGLFVLARKI